MKVGGQIFKEVLPVYGASTILAGPEVGLTGAKIFYNRWNRLVVKSDEKFVMKSVTVSTDGGETYGSNCSVKIEDDFTTRLSLHKGVGYAGVLSENSKLHLANVTACLGQEISGTATVFPQSAVATGFLLVLHCLVLVLWCR